VSEKWVEREVVSQFGILRSGKNGPLPPVLEAPNSENPTGGCLEKRLGLRYQWMAKSQRKLQIKDGAIQDR